MRQAILGSALLACLAGSANAAIFSFASANNGDGPTFSALTINSLSDGRTLDANGVVTLNFLADRDGSGPGAAQSIVSEFRFTASVSGYSVFNFGGQFVHNFSLSGSFSILDLSTNQPIFQSTFSNAVMSSLSNSSTLLSRSATIQANDESDPGLTFTTSGALGDIDVSQQRDFSFALSNLQMTSGARVPVNAGGITQAPWTADASFTASAIPGPGALALMGLGTLIGARRRRA